MGRGKKRFLAPWNSIVGKLSAKSFEDMIESLRHDYFAWKEAQTPQATALEPDVAAKYGKAIHGVMRDVKGHEIGLEALATMLVVRGHVQDEIDAAKLVIRKLAAIYPEMFSVSAGGSPRFRRLLTAKDVPTGATAFVRAGRKARSLVNEENEENEESEESEENEEGDENGDDESAFEGDSLAS